MGFNVTKLFYSKPQTLGEGMQRVVRYASKGAKEATHTIKHIPGQRFYNNGVGILSYIDGFEARLENGITEHLAELAQKSRKASDLKKYAKAANVISRGRTIEGNTEIVTDFFARGWKAIQRFFNQNAASDKMYAQKTVSLPNNINKLNDFCERFSLGNVL